MAPSWHFVAAAVSAAPFPRRAPLSVFSSGVKHNTPVTLGPPICALLRGFPAAQPPCTPTLFLKPNAPRARYAFPRSVELGSPMCTQMYLGPPAPGIPEAASASHSLKSCATRLMCDAYWKRTTPEKRNIVKNTTTQKDVTTNDTARTHARRGVYQPSRDV